MIAQKEFQLQSYQRGFHLITDEVYKELGTLPQTGIVTFFIKHTSAALTVNENTDPDVQEDLEYIFNRIVKEKDPYYRHRDEGEDDMPAHGKSTLVGPSLTIPITKGKLNLGTWQGIYLCEFRKHGGRRTIVATIIGNE